MHHLGWCIKLKLLLRLMAEIVQTKRKIQKTFWTEHAILEWNPAFPLKVRSARVSVKKCMTQPNLNYCYVWWQRLHKRKEKYRKRSELNMLCWNEIQPFHWRYDLLECQWKSAWSIKNSVKSRQWKKIHLLKILRNLTVDATVEKNLIINVVQRIDNTLYFTSY